jgi:ABC-type uncharacterized transport system substrate-binding protein
MNHRMSEIGHETDVPFRAPYVDRVLRGAKPADLPVQVPVKFEMALNVKTAKVLGLTVPASLYCWPTK